MNRTFAVVALLTLVAVACGGDAADGEMEIPAALAARAEITPERAQAIALASVPGSRLLHGELEEEDGSLIYSFDLGVERESGVEEVHVDARSGRIVGREHESTAQEANEESSASH
jgi:uncharacterized membrane protein YkoI